MTSNLKQKTQEAIDTMRELVDGCDLVMLVDRETGLILSKSSAKPLAQNHLEQIAATALADLRDPLAAAVPGQQGAAGLVALTRMHKDDIVVALRTSNDNQSEDALVCQFTDKPDRRDMIDAAGDVFALSASAEAA